MALNIIFGLCMYPVVFLMYFFIRTAVKTKNGYCFGASVKREWEKEEKLQEIRKAFLKSMNRWLLVSAISPIVIFFVPYVSISMTLWMVWLLVMIFYLMIPYVKANKAIRIWKQEQGYSREEDGVVYAELKAAGTVRKVKAISFLIPTVVSLVAVLCIFYPLWKRDHLASVVTVATIAICTPVFHLCAWLMDRQKTEVISTNSEINLNYARAKKNIWKNVWLQIAWINTITVCFFAISIGIPRIGISLVLVGAILFAIACILVVILNMRKLVQVNEQYEDKRDLASLDDSDRYWIGGMLYYNKKDKHVMVEQRTGMGTTMNMATPIGVGMGIFAVVALLSIPIMCVWMILLEFTPIHLYLEDEVIIAEHLNVDYEIPLSEIVEVAVLEEEPDWNKVAGTAMDNLSKGTFEIYREGKCEAFLNPHNEMFLQITTEDTIYYIGGYDDAETEKIYNEILEFQEN